MSLKGEEEESRFSVELQRRIYKATIYEDDWLPEPR